MALNRRQANRENHAQSGVRASERRLTLATSCRTGRGRGRLARSGARSSPSYTVTPRSSGPASRRSRWIARYFSAPRRRPRAPPPSPSTGAIPERERQGVFAHRLLRLLQGIGGGGDHRDAFFRELGLCPLESSQLLL